jgi:D-Tyr-tRNAtyr deacylase
MRAIIQRVNSASVTVENQIISQIGRGVMVLVGVTDGDTKDDADYIQRKVHIHFIYCILYTHIDRYLDVSYGTKERRDGQ